MKLLHVIASMDPRNGGPCQGIRNLAPEVLGAGHNVEIVCLDDPQSSYLALEKHKVHALGHGRTPWCYHRDLLPWLKTNLPRFDAVILNGLWQYPGYALAKACRSIPNPPPYFVYPHGMLDPWFQRAPERRLKAIRNWFYWKAVERHVISQATAVFFTCAEELQLARTTFRPYAPQREINVGYGVAEPPSYHDRMAAAFAEKCPGLNGRPYLLFLSRIHPKKGIDLLLRAYANVYASHAEVRNQSQSPDLRPPTSDLRSAPPALIIAGPGLDTDYGREMQRLAAEACGQQSAVRNQKSDGSGQRSSDLRPPTSDLCPPPQILFPGMLTGDAKWGALYGCEAFALPSHQENFGIAVVEALACGKPVLISNQVNIWREIETSGAGLVGADTETETVETLQRWAQLAASDRTTMNTAARDCYQSRFSVLKSGKNFLETIAQLLTERQRTQQPTSR